MKEEQNQRRCASDSICVRDLSLLFTYWSNTWRHRHDAGKLPAIFHFSSNKKFNWHYIEEIPTEVNVEEVEEEDAVAAQYELCERNDVVVVDIRDLLLPRQAFIFIQLIYINI